MACHDLRAGLDQVGAREPVGADVAVEVLVAHLFEESKRGRIRTRTRAAGHEDVDATVLLGNAPDHRTHGLALAQVGSLERGFSALRGNFIHDGLASHGIAAVHDHMGAAAREFDGGGAAYEGRGTRDEGNFSFERACSARAWMHGVLSLTGRNARLCAKRCNST
jgi:hypothetical protein